MSIIFLFIDYIIMIIQLQSEKRTVAKMLLYTKLMIHL